MKYLILVGILISCGMEGPNYNVSRTHNGNLERRMEVVYKEDNRMKQSMIKSRKKASIHKIQKQSKKTIRKLIN